jgi:ABC-2 type transport system permease protein
MTAFFALFRKDLVLWIGSRRALIMGLVAPVLIAGFLGSIFDTGKSQISSIPIAMTDLDQSDFSRAVVKGFTEDKQFEVQILGEEDANRAVTSGKLRASIVLPKGLDSSILHSMFGVTGKPEILIRHDPSQPMVLAAVRGLLAQHVMGAIGQRILGSAQDSTWMDRARAQLKDNLDVPAETQKTLEALFQNVESLQKQIRADQDVNSSAPAMTLPFDTREVAATANPGQEYNAYGHSFAGMGVQFILFQGIEVGIGVLLARRLGLWQRLRAAPISRSTLLGSRIASAAFISFVLLVAIFVIAAIIFGVRVQGSYVGFAAIAISFALVTGAFGLLVAALGRTPEATRPLAILATLVMVMLGGAWVPSFLFPSWLQTATLAIPTRWAVDGLDAVVWRGQDFSAVLPDIGALLAFAVGFAALAIWRFDWEER